MKVYNYFLLIGTMSLLISACQSNSSRTEEANATENNPTYPTLGSIEEIDSELGNILSRDAKIEILAEGFSWSEGPVWVPQLNALLFSDVPQNTIYQWSESEGKHVYLKPSGYTGIEPASEGEGANGLALDKDGNLFICQHGDRRVSRIFKEQLEEDNPEIVPVVTRFNSKRFNSPNDLVIASGGDIYFTDPPYGMKDQDQDSLKELDFNGVYKLSSEGTLSLLIDSLSRPNGIALSPDERTLYVANSDASNAIWAAYDITETGVENGRVLFDATKRTSTMKGLPDGLKVNKDGIIFATGPGGVYVLTPEGKHLGTILTELATANCAFNENESVLYMTTHRYLTRVKLR